MYKRKGCNKTYMPTFLHYSFSIQKNMSSKKGMINLSKKKSKFYLTWSIQYEIWLVFYENVTSFL